MKIAIIDLYAGISNTGMKSIQEVVLSKNHTFKVFNVREGGKWPFIQDWDMFISTGGPGDPTENAIWSEDWKLFMQALLDYNKKNSTPKPVFLICLSFQLFCHHFKLGMASKRNQPSFGSFACHLTPFGKKDRLFGQLTATFQIADFRSYQITKPNIKNMEQMGVTILAIEKERLHVPKERAVMAVKCADHIYGTQFHPEATGDKIILELSLNKEKHIQELGENKYNEIVRSLQNPEDLNITHSILLPGFL